VDLTNLSVQGELQLCTASQPRKPGNESFAFLEILDLLNFLCFSTFDTYCAIDRVDFFSVFFSTCYY
jgi:hypothetical protein